jgi:hypothetical protein
MIDVTASQQDEEHGARWQSPSRAALEAAE